MPRLTQRNPKYRRHRPSGQAIVTLNGRVHYLGPWNTKASLAEYDRLIGEWLANGRSTPHAASGITIVELVERFWQHVQSYYRHPDGTPTSEVENFKPVLGLVRRSYGAKLAIDFGPLALDAVRGEMARMGWCRTSINRNVARIKSLFRWGVAKELVPPSVDQALRAVPGLRAGRCEAKEAEPVRPVPDAVVDATLPHLSSVVGAMVQIQRLTGARPSEICNLRTADIDTTAKVWIYRPTEHKTAHRGHKRMIFIGPKAQEVIRPFLKPLNPQSFIFSPADAVAERQERMHAARVTSLSCGNRPGTNRVRRPQRRPGDHYDVASYRRAIARAADVADLWAKAGQIIANDVRVIPRWHPHQLRHTAATAIRRQFGIEAAQTMLGHATLSVTELYAEKDAEAGLRIAAAVG